MPGSIIASLQTESLRAGRERRDCQGLAPANSSPRTGGTGNSRDFLDRIPGSRHALRSAISISDQSLPSLVWCSDHSKTGIVICHFGEITQFKRGAVRFGTFCVGGH